MRNFILFFGWLLLALTACRKEADVAPAETSRERNLREVLRIAREGAAMLEDSETTRAAFGRRVDPHGVSCRVSCATRAGEAADTLYYVVNYADEAGFALVAADERIADRLLAVTEQGRYTAGERSGNDGFDLYMEMLERSLDPSLRDSVLVRDTTSTVGEMKREERYSAWTTIGPYVKVRWGQGNFGFYVPSLPYNKYCYNSAGQLCPAGCAAVAVAQIVSYHKKSAGYKITFDGSNRTKTIDWEALTARVGGYSCYWPETTADDIALLMREIGKRSGMDYTVKQSGADLQQSRYAFSALGYDQNPGRRYTFEDVRKELNAGRPVFIRGDRIDTSTNELEGHAWVLDGYKYRDHIYCDYMEYTDGRREDIRTTTYTEYYLHINWGENGVGNGYFREGVFDRSKGYEYDTSDNVYTSRDYRYDLEIMTGIWNKK